MTRKYNPYLAERFMKSIAEEKKNRRLKGSENVNLASPMVSPESREGMIYIPEANIHFAEEMTHLGENWYKTHEALPQENLRMPTMLEFRMALKYFKDHHRDLYDKITAVRNPWRSAWLDAFFEQRNDGLYILTRNKTRAKKLENCLMQDKIPGINLDEWISDSTNQGLPKPNIKDGSLYFWHPRNGMVAGFYAGVGGAGLDCDWDPSGSVSGLGVYAVSDAKT